MTLFLEDRGWVLDLAEPDNSTKKVRGVAMRMTFKGAEHTPRILGEQRLPGHHNYFLGADESAWRTDVPLYGSVRYEDLYPGVDLRLREAGSVPEYDLLLAPGSDISRVTVHVEGAQGMSIAPDGSLVIATALGPLIQRPPQTWELRGEHRRNLPCRFVLLGGDRFGFLAPEWNGATRLVIDPGLIWSTSLASNSRNENVAGVVVENNGLVTIAGGTLNQSFPTTIGAYDTTNDPRARDVFVSKLDPRQNGSAQLVYSTFLGGYYHDWPVAVSVDAGGVVTVATFTESYDFPVTGNAYRTPKPGGGLFISRLDPKKTGKAQLVYSTSLWGISPSTLPPSRVMSADSQGVVTVWGRVHSQQGFVATTGAYNTVFNKTYMGFVSRLDPSKTGSAQLVYSTLLPAASPLDVVIDQSGILTLAGNAGVGYATTTGSYNTTKIGPSNYSDAFLMRLDPRKTGNAQLLYSTFLGGWYSDSISEVLADPNGLVTVSGWTQRDFPTTSGAYDTVHYGVGFVSRLDLRKTGRAQLVYSSLWQTSSPLLAVDENGVITLAGYTHSASFPTTAGAYDTTYSGNGDFYVSRLDPRKTGKAQLVYSTFLGGSGGDGLRGLAVDPSGVAIVAGTSYGATTVGFPTTSGAYNTVGSGVVVSRLSMGVAFYADRYEVSLSKGGPQKLQLDAGKQHAGRNYAIFGSVTGTSPGINLAGIPIPLNPDPYTNITVGAAVAPIFVNFRGVFDKNGEATASFNVPSKVSANAKGLTLYHAYLVYDNTGRIHMASNPVPLCLVP